MPATVDEIKTIMSVAGASSYMAAMMQAAAATENMARRTRRANQDMAASTNVAFDEIAQRWRDFQSGQFVKVQGEGWGGALGVATALVAAYAAEIAILVMTLRQLRVALDAVNREGMKFESVMKDAEIQSGSSAQAMEKVKAAALSEELVALGISGTMAADAYKLLASEGYSAAEMQQAMIPIMQTAVATGAGQAQMTKTMLSIMRQYKYDLSDLPAIGNAITAALNKTTFQIDDLMGAMKYAGPIAANMGWSFGETVAVLNVLYQQMGNFEMVGTGFRGVMNALMTPSVMMRDAFAEAGLDINDFQKYAGDAGATLQWLQKGTWDQSLIMRAFGAEAGLAATILIGAAVPAIESTGQAIDTTGNVARDAANKMSTLEGEVAKLTAGFNNLKVKLFEASKTLSSDMVQGASLARQAVTEYLDDAIDRAEKNGKAMGENRDLQLQVAEAIITAGSGIAQMAIQVSRAIAFQTSFILAQVAAYHWLRQAMMEWELVNRQFWPGVSEREEKLPGWIASAARQYEQAKTASQAATDWAVGGLATKAIEEVQAAEASMLKRLGELQAFADVSAGAGGHEGVKDTTKTPGGGNAPKAVVEDLDDVNKLYTQKLAAISEITQQQKAQTLDAARQGQIELAGKRAALQLLKEQEAANYRLTTDAEKRRDATLARMRGETAVMEAQNALQRTQAKVNEEERDRNVQYFEKLAKGHKALNDAVRMVIGGRLSELVKDQIDRLGGGELQKKRHFLGAIRQQGNNRIIIDLNYSGPLSDGMKNDIASWLTGTVRKASASAPL